MITDSRVLETDYVPRDIVHRDHELNTLASALRPLTNGDRAETALLSGPTGVGKICTARYVVDQLEETVTGVDVQYVNCWEHYSRFKVLYQLLDGLDKTIDIHRQSTPTDVLLDRLKDHTTPYVAICDEADQLEDKGVLYDLYRIPTLELILIANHDDEFLRMLPDRVTSRLQTSTRIQFNPYTNDELVSILTDRVKWGLRDGVITDTQLHSIADAAAGDARVAIGTLRTAARRADQQNHDSIADKLIKEAVSDAKAEIKQKTVEQLTPHQTIIYNIIADSGEITPGELYEQYREQASNPRSKRMMRNYLTKLCHYNLIEAEGKNRGRFYRPVT